MKRSAFYVRHENSTVSPRKDLKGRRMMANKTLSLSSPAAVESVCLDAMILETIKCEAEVCGKGRDVDFKQTIECYEEILKHLIRLKKSHHWHNASHHTVVVEGVLFIPITRDQYKDIMVNTLVILRNYSKVQTYGVKVESKTNSSF